MKSVCLPVQPLSSSRFRSWKEIAGNISQDWRGTWTPLAFAPDEGLSGTDSLICFVCCLLLFPDWLVGTDRSVSLTIIRDAWRQEVTVSDISSAFPTGFKMMSFYQCQSPIPYGVLGPVWNAVMAEIASVCLCLAQQAFPQMEVCVRRDLCRLISTGLSLRSEVVQTVLACKGSCNRASQRRSLQQQKCIRSHF